MKKLWWVCCALLMMAVSVQAWADSKPTVYGKNLLRSNDLSAETIARFIRVNTAKLANAKPNFDDTRDWVDQPLTAPSSGNPYTLVVRVSGTAMADGEVSTSWTGGWEQDGATRISPMLGANTRSAKAGERVTLIGVSSPVSFKEDRRMSPALGFVSAKNIRIDSVQFEVWSGVGKANFVQLVWAWSPLLVGVVFLGLFFWFRRG